MARIYPINEQPYIELIRYADMDDRLNHAFDFIDSVIIIFVKWAEKDDGQALLEITKAGHKAWKKIARYDIVVHIDEEGYEYLLEPQTYPDYFMQRFLETANNKKDYDHMVNCMKRIFRHFKWEFNDPGSFPASAPSGEGEARE